MAVAVAKSDSEWVDLGATVIADLMRRALDQRGGCTCLLSGGTTPGAVYQQLASADIDWSRVTLHLADERVVPAGDPSSNHRMVEETLVRPLAGRVELPLMYDHAVGQAESIRRCAARLPGVVDLIVLGIGADGHTASLFPDDVPVGSGPVVRTCSPNGVRERLSVSANVIRSARSLVVLARGGSKAEAVRRALCERPGPPAAIARDGMWVLDEDAASHLPKETSP